jgi:hypothetical protein
MTLPPCLAVVLIKTRLSPRAVSILFASCVSASGPMAPAPLTLTHTPFGNPSDCFLRFPRCRPGLRHVRLLRRQPHNPFHFRNHQRLAPALGGWAVFHSSFPATKKRCFALLPPRNIRHRSRFWWGGTRWTTAPASRARRWSARLQPTRKPAPTTTAAARRAPAAFLDALTVAPDFILSVLQLQSLCLVSPCWRTRQHPSFSIFL